MNRWMAVQQNTGFTSVLPDTEAAEANSPTAPFVSCEAINVKPCLKGSKKLYRSQKKIWKLEESSVAFEHKTNCTLLWEMRKMTMLCYSRNYSNAQTQKYFVTVFPTIFIMNLIMWGIISEIDCIVASALPRGCSFFARRISDLCPKRDLIPKDANSLFSMN